MEGSNSKQSEVAIIKSKTPKEGVLNGLEQLGGISKYIKEDDQVFIKFNLNFPGGFPTVTSFDVLEVLIKSCTSAGAKKIYLGGYPPEGISIKEISDALDIERSFKEFGAELAFLDNSNCYNQKKINPELQLKLKNDSFSKIQVNDKEFEIPKVIINLSVLNSFSMVPNKYQKIEKKILEGKDYFALDQYKRDLIPHIFDVYAIKKPDIVINDLFHVLESAGPWVYKDSKLKKTGYVIVGNDAVAVDLVTLNAMNIEALQHELIMEARERNAGSTDLSKIITHGEKLKDISINIEECVAKLTDINVQNISVKQGQICSGCKEQAYHLLNTMKTKMLKDLKYLSRNSFLIGENPLEPDEDQENIILFGDCAINSTQDRDFRKIVKETKKKIKIKKNKKILELGGCPPNFVSCIDEIINYYKKRNIPSLNLYDRTVDHELRKSLDKWEAL